MTSYIGIQMVLQLLHHKTNTSFSFLLVIRHLNVIAGQKHGILAKYQA